MDVRRRYALARPSAKMKGQWKRIAGVAQLVEHLICNQRVGGSNPSAGSTQFLPPGSSYSRFSVFLRIRQIRTVVNFVPTLCLFHGGPQVIIVQVNVAHRCLHPCGPRFNPLCGAFLTTAI